jgi:hypothetical protein
LLWVVKDGLIERLQRKELGIHLSYEVLRVLADAGCSKGLVVSICSRTRVLAEKRNLGNVGNMAWHTLRLWRRRKDPPRLRGGTEAKRDLASRA